ncbi:MAG: CDP-glucose 4,6-dehydratase [Rhizobiaceae bacterium]|nr:CDP-glucose 4,6-dehydratase [Rhizobiaceae bacterium]
MVVDPDFWRGKRVAITGHTGFKGGWLALWLVDMGAEVFGLSLEPNTHPNFFELTGLEGRVSGHTIGDIRDTDTVLSFFDAAQPEIVFHLAAQALVRRSYDDPIETVSTNVLGTANVLQSCRQTESVRTIINVTSDKCYHNNEEGRAFVETDPMGGHDVYSASKGAAELIAHAFSRSFDQDANQHMASVRAGNVIGGGDWSADRLVPDYFRSVEAVEVLRIRSPQAVRPWQHVLEPLSGYLRLAEQLHKTGDAFSGGWNFGPDENSVKTVRWVVDTLVSLNGGEVVHDNADQPPEAIFLSLNSGKANRELGWHPRWSIETALKQTAVWETARLNGEDMADVSISQIAAYKAGATSE